MKREIKEKEKKY